MLCTKLLNIYMVVNAKLDNVWTLILSYFNDTVASIVNPGVPRGKALRFLYKKKDLIDGLIRKEINIGILCNRKLIMHAIYSQFVLFLSHLPTLIPVAR